MSDTTELGPDVIVDPVTGEIIDEKNLALQLLEQSLEEDWADRPRYAAVRVD